MWHAFLKKFVFSPLKAEKSQLVVLIFALTLMALSDAAFLLLIKNFVAVLFGQSSDLKIPAPFSRFITSEDLFSHGVYAVPFLLLCAGLSKALASYFYSLKQQTITLSIVKNYRSELFARILAMPYEGIRKRQVGEWMSIIMNDVLFLQQRCNDMLTALLKDTVTVVTAFGVLAYLHWPTALALLVVSPLLGFGMGKIGKKISRYAEEFQKELAHMAGMLLEQRARFDFIRAQQGESREIARFSRANQRYYDMIRRSIFVRSAFAPGLEWLGFMAFALAVYAVGQGLLSELSEILMPFFVALGLMLKPLKEIGEQLSRWHETKGTLQASFAVYKEAESYAAWAPIVSMSPNFNGLNIKTVTAGLDARPLVTIQDTKVNPNESIAIIGPSGAGKSTILKTFAALLPPLTWDASLPWSQFCSHAAMVSQDPFLFQATLFANLVYGLESLPRMEDVRLVLSEVNILAEIDALTHGLDTPFTPLSPTLSGGQIQRLVIARALLRRRPILLLDEATSALDEKTEKDITDRLLAKTKATSFSLIAVTHRLKWLHKYDKVWFVEGGVLKFEGTHEELMKIPRYREFCVSHEGE